MMHTHPTSEEAKSDEGSILIIALVFSTVLSLIVVGLATYASSTVRLGQVAERSADRLASANGAMDSALEDIERGVGPCKLLGQDYVVTDSVNGMKSTVDCNWVGGRFNVGDLFAVVMTGAGAGRTGPLLTVTNGGNSANAEKIFEGPVYLAAPPTSPEDPAVTDPTTEFKADLTIKNADLMYSATDCSSAKVSLSSDLTIAPVGYGTQCYQDPWNDPEMFGSFAPAEPGINSSSFPSRLSTPPAQDSLGCYIWPPGRYATPPQTLNGSFNYFQSGDYFLDGIGDWNVKNSYVLFGYPGVTGPSIPGIQSNDSFATNPCRNAWKTDPNAFGATVYFGGNSQLTVDGLGAVEISGRERSGQNIAVQALEKAPYVSTIVGDQRLIRTQSGGNKQLAIQGLVWAPYAALEFDLISNEAVAALTGGAVVSEISAGASANTNNFLIRVDTEPKTKFLELTTTATSEGNQGSTSVKTVVAVQIDKGATSYALNSRRVVGLTPEDATSTPTTTAPTGTTLPPTTTLPPPSDPCTVGAGDWTHNFGDGGWTAEFWNKTSAMPESPSSPFSGEPSVTQNVSQIYKPDNGTSPMAGVNATHYTARFTKTFDVTAACEIKLQRATDDGVRVKVNTVTWIDDWNDHAFTTSNVSNVPLNEGMNTIVFEFYQRGGSSGYSLQWRD